jgi:hypothetical protein
MTLSNKILIGFFGFIFLYLTAVFVEIRLAGTPNAINDSNSKAEVVDLSGIHYIVVDDVDRNVNIIQSDRLQLEVRSFTGDLLKDLKYQISGDTLKLLSFKSEDKRATKITVLVPKESLHGIYVKSSDVIVSGLEQSRLQLSQNDGRIWMSDSKLTNLKMGLIEKSFINVSETDIDTLSASIDKSEAHVNSLVGFVRGEVTNESYLRLSGIREIQIKKDESSNLNMY